MTKNELKQILNELKIQVNEGITSNLSTGTYPRIVFWDYIWEDVTASGNNYTEKETYQISFYSKEPRHKKLIELRSKIRENGLHPIIFHEYIEKDRVFHSYMSLDVTV